MNKLRGDWRLIAILALPGLLIFTAILPLPLARTVMLSFYSWDGIADPVFTGMKNFLEAVTIDTTFWRSLANTFYLAAGCIVLELPLALVLAYWFGTGKVRGSKFFRAVFYFPSIVSGTATGLMWNMLLQPDVGLVDGFIRAIGFKDFNFSWLGNPHTAIWAIVVSIAWQSFGYHMLIFSAGMSTISKDVFDAASIDGAGEWRQIVSIAAPMLKQFFIVNIILVVSSSIIAFAHVLAMTNGGPGDASSVLALQMYKQAFLYQRYGYGNALATILFVLNLVLVGSVTLLSRSPRGRVHAASRDRTVVAS